MRFDLVGKPPRKEGTKFTSAKPGEGNKYIRGRNQTRHTPHKPYIKFNPRSKKRLSSD